MKYIIIIPLFFLTFFVQDNKYVYFGKKSIYKVYFENSDSEKILIEIGGSDMKFGGEHIVLEKKLSKKNEIIFENKNKDIILKKKNDKTYLFFYYNKFGKNWIILSKTKYSNSIDRVRQNGFRMVHKEYKRIDNYDDFLSEFNKFKSNPLEY